jgi:hypothetical protein
VNIDIINDIYSGAKRIIAVRQQSRSGRRWWSVGGWRAEPLPSRTSMQPVEPGVLAPPAQVAHVAERRQAVRALHRAPGAQTLLDRALSLLALPLGGRHATPHHSDPTMRVTAVTGGLGHTRSSRASARDGGAKSRRIICRIL